MDTLPSSFSIEVNGKPIAKISDTESTKTQAKVESGSDPAVFELKNGRLGCGGWMLGRNMTEDRSMGPKKVMWFKMSEEQETSIYPITAEKEGDSYVLRFGGSRLIEEEGNVFANLFDDGRANVLVKMN